MKGKVSGKAARALALAVALVMALMSVPALAATPKYTTRLEVDKTEVAVVAGKQFKVTLTAWTPDGEADDVKYGLSDKSVVRYVKQSKGLRKVVTLKALKAGTCRLTFYSMQTDGPEIEPVTVDITVYPKKPKPTSIALNHTEVTIRQGEKLSLNAEVEPYHPKQKKVAWKSKNPKIASVGGKGVVTGKKVGTATIVARIGKLQSLCTVHVIAKDAPDPNEPPEEEPGGDETPPENPGEDETQNPDED